MTVAGADKLTFFLSNIRSCNDTPNFPFIFHGNLSGDLTAAVKLL